MTVPAVVGSNCTANVAVCLGFSVSGKLGPETEKPAPVIVAEVTVTAAVPVEVKVNVCVPAVLTVTLPNLKLAALTLSVGVAADAALPKRARGKQRGNSVKRFAHRCVLPVRARASTRHSFRRELCLV